MAGGRPEIEITEEIIAKARKLASQGMQQEQIAPCLGLGVRTYYEKKNKYPQLEQAIKEGQAEGVAKVTEALLNNIQLGNVTAQIFYLKCQAGWKEQKEDISADSKSLVERLIDKL